MFYTFLLFHPLYSIFISFISSFLLYSVFPFLLFPPFSPSQSVAFLSCILIIFLWCCYTNVLHFFYFILFILYLSVLFLLPYLLLVPSLFLSCLVLFFHLPIHFLCWYLSPSLEMDIPVSRRCKKCRIAHRGSQGWHLCLLLICD